MKNFIDIDEGSIIDSTLIIDVDGTLVPDKTNEISANVIEKIKRFSIYNDVFICSNGSPQNAESFSSLAGVKNFKCFKPFKGDILDQIDKNKRIVVVGDKFLTDGLFALNVGGEFLKVRHVIGKDSLSTKITYFIDDFVWDSKNLFKLMRPFQWVKNLLVFAPLFFAGAVYNKEYFIQIFLAAIIFSVFSSVVYIFNDIYDVEGDRKHPLKKNRPIASNLVSVNKAIVFLGLLLFVGFILIYFLPKIVPVILAYLFLNFIYTIWLKKVAIVDSISVSLCYVLRVIAGGLVISIYLSPWIILCVFFGSLFVVFGKRRSEFSRDNRRLVMEFYSEKGLDYAFVGSAIATLVIYAIWSVLGHNSPYLIYSNIFVCVVVFRLLNLIFIGSHYSEAPEILVFKDRVIFITFLFWFVYMAGVFYLSIFA